MPAARLLAPHEVVHGAGQVGRVIFKGGRDDLVAQLGCKLGDVSRGEVQERVEVGWNNLKGTRCEADTADCVGYTAGVRYTAGSNCLDKEAPDSTGCAKTVGGETFGEVSSIEGAILLEGHIAAQPLAPSIPT